ncbi:MAG: type II toxin-antitoxin system VapC family toxin [Pirellulales bacterium]|nr:type II toxin-antitoxin system VapC family toxin [Pirellulales bacterium]
MDAVLIDTDVFSFLFKRDTRGDRYLPAIQGKVLCLSFMSVAELQRWALIRNWGEPRRRSLEQVMRQYVVLAYDAETARHWARISVERSRSGKPIACGDCWIAACATRHGIPLVTHNARDFDAIDGLDLVLGRGGTAGI